MRKKGQNYPVFLTDIDLSAVRENSSILDSLHYKKIIEQKLMREIAK